MTYGNVFPINPVNSYASGGFYDYVADITSATLPDYLGAGDSTSGTSKYWSTGDPFADGYYNENCRSEWRHRRYVTTGKAVVGYNWNLFNVYSPDAADPTTPGGGGYGTLLKLSYTLPVKNNTSAAKVPLWTWCDITRPGYRTAGNAPPALRVLSCRWCSSVVGECSESQSGAGGNAACCHQCTERTAIGEGDNKCWQVTYTTHATSIELGVTGCCETWTGTNIGSTGNFDAFFQAALGVCGWRTMPTAQWDAITAETTYWWGLAFWGVDQLNPVVLFQSGWINWIATTGAEDTTVRDQLGTAGKLPVGPRPSYVDDNTLAVYKVTKSLAHCDRKRFDLKLIWARTTAYGVTFSGPKSVPTTYPSTGSIFWD
jgi:hypothetical protein